MYSVAGVDAAPPRRSWPAGRAPGARPGRRPRRTQAEPVVSISARASPEGLARGRIVGGCSMAWGSIGVTRRPLEAAVVADELRHHLRCGVAEDLGRRVVLGQDCRRTSRIAMRSAQLHGLLDVVGDEDDRLAHLTPGAGGTRPGGRERVTGSMAPERLVHEEHRRVGRPGPRATPTALPLARRTAGSGSGRGRSRGRGRRAPAARRRPLRIRALSQPSSFRAPWPRFVADGLVREQPDLPG